MFDQDEITTASLSGLGAMLLDAVDEATRSDEVEDIEQAYKEIGQEVLRRIPESSDKHLSDNVEKWLAEFVAENELEV